ncbi:hypothetical protein AMAG_00993 [Allomyces macrogynus ATCC 38327]|uniref:YABBY protein C-terminal domain-containing protein n=1 Tax=Allomyces macrogynus (strain ATCC 38327) TaxID=578462 RepID=A0A0L0RYD2_ALLM3|nr:hypothetical protein AMAG_00993 [Allomyces macrogynus ATCC 38327]|eukprot:KNE55056.1 hypothetical protein AMAG_00993 [Allomyces macrogynus ATCC 38327]
MHSSTPHARSSQRAPATPTTSRPATAAAASARDTTSPTTKAKRKTGVKRGSPYTAFMAHELKRVKAQHPQMRHQDVFKLAAANWRYHPTNPKRIATTTTPAPAAPAAQMPTNHGGSVEHRQPDGHQQDDGDGEAKVKHETGSVVDEEL